MVDSSTEGCSIKLKNMYINEGAKNGASAINIHKFISWGTHSITNVYSVYWNDMGKVKVQHK